MDSQLSKTVVEAATLVGLAAGVGFISKKPLKTSLTSDPSTSLENYGKWVAALAIAVYLRNYLQKEKILPA